MLDLHAGPEPDNSERRLAVALGVQDRVRFLGVVPAVLQVFHAADGYLMPSSLEGFGIAAVEAMGCGILVILGDRAALHDLKDLTPGTWGPLEADALAAAVRELAGKSGPERRSEGAEAGRVVQELFGTATGAEGYLDAYREALAESSGMARRRRSA